MKRHQALLAASALALVTILTACGPATTFPSPQGTHQPPLTIPAAYWKMTEHETSEDREDGLHSWSYEILDMETRDEALRDLVDRLENAGWTTCQIDSRSYEPGDIQLVEARCQKSTERLELITVIAQPGLVGRDADPGSVLLFLRSTTAR